MSLQLIPYLVMDGKAAQAITFYEQALGARVSFRQTFGDLPEDPENPIASERRQHISHATMHIGNSVVMIRDTVAGESHQLGSQVTIAISTYDVDEARRMFDALHQGGHVTLPMQATPFSPAYGRVTDKFGISFQIAAQFSD